MAEQLTPLADYSRQPMQVGTPPLNLYNHEGHKQNAELVQLSALLRIADALERQGEQLATVCIDPYRALDFRDLVEEFDGAPYPLAIAGWQFTDVSSLSVTLSFEDAGVLFVLGARWNWEREREEWAREQGGGQADG